MPVAPQPEWVDLGAVHRLAARVARVTRRPQEPGWAGLLGPHWPLAEFDWHRRRTTPAGEETQHLVTRYALLQGGGLVRADRSAVDEAGVPGPWTGRVRAMTTRDVRALDRAPQATSTTHGGTTTWGVQPDGAPLRPWAGGGVEHLLSALLH